MVTETSPLTITSHNQELIVLVDIVYLDVWISGDYLLFWGKIGALLEFEIAYCARQSKVTVDAAKVDKATCGLNTCFLGWKILAVIANCWRVCLPSFCGLWSNERGFALPFTPRTVRESPALACLCERRNVVGCGDDIRRRFCLLSGRRLMPCNQTLLLRTWDLLAGVRWPVIDRDDVDIQLTTQNLAICCQEAVLQSLFDVSLFECFLLCDNLVQLLTSIQRHLVATVSVVHTEEGQSLVGGRALGVVGIEV